MIGLLPINSCFESDCRCQSERIHLPIADKCDAGCYFCQYRRNGNLSDAPMPGHSSFIPRGPAQIEKYLRDRLLLLPSCKIIGISGPGDILTSMDQMRTVIDILRKPEFSHLYACLCTNGWHYQQAAQLLEQWTNLKYITVTVNTLREDIFSQVYRVSGKANDFQSVLANQTGLMEWAADHGVLLKINTVLNDYNQQNIIETWQYLRDRYPVAIFNLMLMKSPEESALERAQRRRAYRARMEEIDRLGFHTKKNCRHCRSDSFGKW